MDSRVTKNHITPKIVERLEILCKEKEYPYPLVINLGELIIYKNNIINLKIKPI